MSQVYDTFRFQTLQSEEDKIELNPTLTLNQPSHSRRFDSLKYGAYCNRPGQPGLSPPTATGLVQPDLPPPTATARLSPNRPAPPEYAGSGWAGPEHLSRRRKAGVGQVSRSGPVAVGGERPEWTRPVAVGGERPEWTRPVAVGGERPEWARPVAVGGERPEWTRPVAVGGERPEWTRPVAVGGERPEWTRPVAVGGERPEWTRPVAVGGERPEWASSVAVVKDSASLNPVCDRYTFYQYHRPCTASTHPLILFDKILVQTSGS
ncbi:hypothetical protein J6590_066198 [Homalodisca vitripennis]|nr:hypothetical protein J6590_066198 [Homalodisca vitripennis]